MGLLHPSEVKNSVPSRIAFSSEITGIIQALGAWGYFQALKHSPMRSFFTLALLVCTTASMAQCVNSNMGLDPDLAGWWSDADRSSDVSIVGAMEPGYSLGDVLAIRTDASGQLIWETYIATTNSMV